MHNKTIITISRQYGSGGRKIGEMLAKKLDIPFYDNELIVLAAKESGYGEEVFKNAEQQAPHSLLYSLSMFGTNAGIYNLPLNDQVFLIQSDVIKKVASEGPCVIVGRSADYVLADREDVVNVFVFSDLANRVKRAVEEYGCPADKAEEIVAKTDKRRGTYYTYYTGNKWGRAENYDLCINSDSVGLEQTVEVIAAFVRLREAKRGQKD